MTEPRLLLTQQWLLKAQSDFESARHLASGQTPHLDTAIYHCQQCGEKAIKGFLFYCGHEPEWTHDVARLVEIAATYESALISLIPYGAELAPYATAFRYPSESNNLMPSRDQFDSAIFAAQRIFEFVCGVLPPQIRQV
jgi:HEPN domain-containing protein